MAFTTTADLKLTASDVVDEALEMLGVLAEGDTANANQLTSSIRTLNNLIKLWQAESQIYAQGEYRLNLVADTGEYTLDVNNVGYIPMSIVNATLINAAYYDSANLTVPYDTLAVSTYTAGETVTFSGGSTGIVITDNATDSMTIRLAEGATTPANDETMLGGTSGTTSTVNGTATAIAQSGDSEEIPLTPLSQQEWYALTNKRTTGTVTQYYYKRNPVEVGGTLSLWPVPEDTTYDMKLWIQYPYRDIDASTDDVYFTQEWYLALTFQLAYLLSYKYGIPLQERMMMKESADEFFWLASTHDRDGSMFFQPRGSHG